MKEFVEKLMSMLEKQIFSAELHDYGWEGQTVHNLLVLGDVKDIAEQLLEEHEECYKDCGECEAYDREKHHCPKFCKVITEAVKEIEENHR